MWNQRGLKVMRVISSLILVLATLWSPTNITTTVGAKAEKINRVAAPTVTTWYVATTGNDTNACTSSGAACRTVGGAIAKAAGGDTIIISSGTFTESNTITKSLTLIGNGAVNTLLDGNNATRVFMINPGVTLKLYNLTVQRGSAGPYANGGGLFNQGALFISNTHILNNYAGNFGSGIFNDNGTVRIYGSTLAGNTSRSAIGQWSGTITISNTTFTGNVGDAGGGALEAYGGTVRLDHITVVGNSGGSAGGLYYGGNAVNASVSNSIIAGNTSGNPSYPNCANLYSWGGNLFGATGGGCPHPTPPPIYPPDKFSDNPRVSALRDNGGPTFTRELLAGSLAVDLANPTSCAGTDQRGVVRGATCDAGAVEGTPELSVVKTALTFLLTPNVPLTYTMIISNAGALTATNPSLVDTLPNGLTFGSLQTTLGPCTGGTSIQCTWSSLAPNTIVTVTVHVTPTQLGRVTNAVNVKQPLLEYLADNTSTATTTIGTTDLGLSKRVSSFGVNAGERLTYTLSISNVGANNTAGVIVSDVLASGLNFVSATTTRGSYNAATGQWSVGTLAVNQIATLTLAITPSISLAGKIVTNTAAIVAQDLNDLNNANNTASVPIGVGVDLALTQSAGRSPTPVGLPISFTVTISNAGPNLASGIIVTDAWPSTKLSFVNAVPSQGNFTYGTGQWSVGSLAPNLTATLTLNGVPLPDANNTTVTNVARIAAADQADTPNNNVASASTVVASPDISVSKTILRPTYLETAGGTLVYRLTAANVGTYAASQIIISDVVPAPVTVVTTTASAGAYDAQSGEWAFGPLAIGAQATLDLTVTVPSSLANHTITNTAQLTAIVPQDLNTSNDQSQVAVYVGGVDVQLSQTVSPTHGTAGQPLTFTLGINNAAPTLATGVRLSDTWPSELTFSGAAVFDPHNVLRLNLDESPALDGFTLADRSGYGHDGTLITNDFVNKTRTGRWGKALLFDGSDDHVVVPHVISDSFSISFWLSTTQSTGSASAPWTQGFGLVDAGDPGFGVALSGGAISFGASSVVSTTHIHSGAFVADGAWHHVVATRDALTGELALYIDGALKASAIGVSGTLTSTQGDQLWIGGLISGTTDVNFFNGLLDEVLIVNRVLSEPEALALYQRTSPYGTCTSQVMCEIGALDTNEAVTVTIAATLSDTQRFTHTAWVWADQIDVVPGNNVASVTVGPWRVYLPVVVR